MENMMHTILTHTKTW